jgi:hypothetical protein
VPALFVITTQPPLNFQQQPHPFSLTPRFARAVVEFPLQHWLMERFPQVPCRLLRTG